MDTTIERCYFDWAATAVPDMPCPPEPAAFGNPSSQHREGRQARECLEHARSRCAAVLGVPSACIYFTSGGTESNALVLHAMLRRKSNASILASAVEHPSIRENCLILEQLGKRIGFIGVEKDGRVTIPALEKALAKQSDARFAAIMAVNNETGALMDMSGLVVCMRSSGKVPIHVHSDLVQAVGKVPLDITGWDVDSASISGHKLGGPRGIGLLYLRKPLDPLYVGGAQERGVRPGTENTPGALALAACLERRAIPATVQEEYGKAAARFKELIRFLRSTQRCSLIPEDRQEEDPRFSPYIVQVGFKGIPGEVMVRTLDDAGFAVSTGSACSSSAVERPILAAMGLDNQTRLEGIRISQGWSSSADEIARLISALQGILSRFRGTYR